MRSNTWRSSLRRFPRRAPGEPGYRGLSTRARPQPTSDRCRLGLFSRGGLLQARFNATASTIGEDGAAQRSTLSERPSRGRARAREIVSTGIPPPPPLPDWFLKFNVKFSDPGSANDQHPGSQSALHLLDPYNDEELLAIPYPSDQHESVEKSNAGDSSKPGDVDSSGEIAETKHEGFIDQLATGFKNTFADRDAASIAIAVDGGAERESSSSVKESDGSLKVSDFETYSKGGLWTRLQTQLLIQATFQSIEQTDGRFVPRNLVVYSPDETSHEELDRFVEDTADLARADIIRIDASDIAELAGSYIDPSGTELGSIAGLAYDVYEGAQQSKPSHGSTLPQPPASADTGDASEQSGEGQESSATDLDALRAGNVDAVSMLKQRLEQFIGKAADLSVEIPVSGRFLHQNFASGQRSKQDEDEEVVAELDRWQRLKLKQFFEALLTAPTQARAKNLNAVQANFAREKFFDIKSRFRNPDLRRELVDASEERRTQLEERFGRKRPAMAKIRQDLAKYVESVFGNDEPATAVIRKHEVPFSTDPTSASGTIVHVRDISLIHESPHGDDIIRQLKHAVQARQKNGEKIMIIGTDSEFSGDVVTPLKLVEEDDLDGEEGFLKIIYAAPDLETMAISPRPDIYPVQPGYGRLLELNLRNIQHLIARLEIPCSPQFLGEFTRRFLYAPGTQKLGNSMLSPSQIHKIVLVADGFRLLYTESSQLTMPHLAIGLSIIDMVDHGISAITNPPRRPQPRNVHPAPLRDSDSPRTQDVPIKSKQVNIEELRRFTSSHEQRLFSGIVDPANIKTTYDNVHVAPETIDALKTVTTLALLRPDAFKYGVLAKDRLTGLLLYGPPGTGKTLLAKAVAKDAQATVLEVSGAQVYEKYVGEGEKMVRAVFSLAKKLSPCVVFIDEADALFGTRGQSGNRNTHREIINQFLREWDGMDSHNIFLMVASNRPFEIDDAVLRRLPRRILVDLPTKTDRESILRIHLTGETLDAEVELSKLAEQTPFYSGSDLKNVCVAAALAAVKEENVLLEKNKDDKDFRLPDRRTLTVAHFDKATQEISASISEDMRSLNAIKKFDQQYGDRRGRKKKESYGFAGGAVADDEAAARVRGGVGPKP